MTQETKLKDEVRCTMDLAVVAASRERRDKAYSDLLPNKGIELSKPEYLGGSWPIMLSIVESGFAAHAQCSADTTDTCTSNSISIINVRLAADPPCYPDAEGRCYRPS
jgi:hypothetical protein